ncbi:hypothetical protein LEMLEM_LOCUS15910, partial [Lemmus lemmus]
MPSPQTAKLTATGRGPWYIKKALLVETLGGQRTLE